MPSPSALFLIAVAVVWILARQLRTAEVRPRLLVLVPIVLGYEGLRTLPTTWDAWDGVLLAASVVASVGLGWWRGTTLVVWRGPEGAWLRRGTAATAVLWGVLFAARGLLAAVGHATGSNASTGASVLLCCLALSFAAQNSVTLLRVGSWRRPTDSPALKPAVSNQPGTPAA